MSSGKLFKKKRAEQDFYLQITSLIDTLVIILVFMLMTIGQETIEMEVAQGLTLPWAIKGADLVRSVKLIAKKDGILVGEEKVIDLQNAEIPKNILTEDGRKIQPLFEKLSELARESKKAATESKVKFDGKILLQADKDISLVTIKKILYTSARAGYNDFKFAVVKQ